MKLFTSHLIHVKTMLARSDLSTIQKQACERIDGIMQEYNYQPASPRSWFFFQANTESKSEEFKIRYGSDKGHTLKLRILLDLSNEIEATHSIEELDQLVFDIETQDSYSILAKAQGIDLTTHLGLRKTASIKVLEKLISEQRSKLTAQKPETGVHRQDSGTQEHDNSQEVFTL